MRRHCCTSVVFVSFSTGYSVESMWGQFLAQSKNCENRLSALSCLSIYLSGWMEQLSSNWTDFLEVWYLKIFLKIYQKDTGLFKI